MKVESLKDKLRWAVTVAEKTTGKNLSLSALNYVSLEAKERQLKISATNLDLGVELAIPARVEKEGRVLVSPNTLSNFLNTLEAEKIVLETINNNLAISSHHNSSLFRSYPVDDFPSIPKPKTETKISLPLAVFVSGLRAVWYSAAISDIKPEIASVYIYQDHQDLVFVATDSFRLAEKRLTLSTPLSSALKLIIPIKNIAEIIRVVGELNAEELIISLAPHQVSFEVAGVLITSRLIEGVFPDYRQIIAPQGSTEAILLKAELIRALKLSQIFSDRLNQINLKIIPAEKLFELNSRNNEIGENTTKLDAALTGDPLEVGFNVRYLLDSFQSLTADSVSLQGNGKNKPLVLRPVGDQSFVYLVMPLNR